jgi:hypothetical protein
MNIKTIEQFIAENSVGKTLIYITGDMDVTNDDILICAPYVNAIEHGAVILDCQGVVELESLEEAIKILNNTKATGVNPVYANVYYNGKEVANNWRGRD